MTTLGAPKGDKKVIEDTTYTQLKRIVDLNRLRGASISPSPWRWVGAGAAVAALIAFAFCLRKHPR